MKFVLTATAVLLFASVVRATVPRTESVAPVVPSLLSTTGLYADVLTLTIDPRNRPFSPQYPLWSDGAVKRRWVQLPAGAKIDVTDVARWEMPVGTKFWKEFSFGGRKVETRFLWRTSTDRWTFATYAWNEAQTDATLVPEDGLADVVEVAAGKRHSIPSIADCRSCHDSNRTEALGFDALQLSDDRDPNALHAEPLTPEMVTLRTLITEELTTPRRAELVAAPPRIPASSPVTRTALGYLSTNCGNCHNRESSIASLGLLLKHSDSTPDDSRTGAAACTAALATTVNKRGHWIVPEAQVDSRIINPGRPDASALLRRVKSRRPSSQMPPIGSVVADREAIDLLTSWIQNSPEEWAAIAKCGAQ